MSVETITKKEAEEIAFRLSASAIKVAGVVAEPESPVFIEEACIITGYERSTIYVMISKGEIPYHKAAGRRRVFFYKSELLSWMNQDKKEVSHG